MKGTGYIDWYPYKHPQLGKVELGGWDFLHVWTNPPPEFLEKEISPFPEWIVWHALISPRLALLETKVTFLGAGSYYVRFVVQNEGWLPTYVTKRALERKLTRGVIAEISLPKGAVLQSGKQREELGELEGRAYKTAFSAESKERMNEGVKVEWVVKARAGAKVKLLAKHERAGVVRAEVVLK